MTWSPLACDLNTEPPQHVHPNVLRAHEGSQECVQYAPSLTKYFHIPCHVDASTYPREDDVMWWSALIVNLTEPRSSWEMGSWTGQTTLIDLGSHLS